MKDFLDMRLDRSDRRYEELRTLRKEDRLEESPDTSVIPVFTEDIGWVARTRDVREP